MNILSAFTWWQWMILGFIPALIVALYFLKLRRQPLQVPSTYLWTKAIEDLHVNSFWQRLRNSLLLWLQLLLICLLLLSGFRPGCRGEQLVGERFIFLIDTSASMSAMDMEEGKTRLDLAKEHCKALVDRMKPKDVAMIISFSDRAYPHQSYTSNKSLLKRKINEIKQTQYRTELKEALIAASGLANPGRTSNREDNRDVQVAEALEAKIFIVSDGGVAEVQDFSMAGLTPEYHPIGAYDPPDNIGIIAFSVSQSVDDDKSFEAYARFENFGNEDKSIDFSLYANGDLHDSKSSVLIKANQTRGVQFDLSAALEKFDLPIELRLQVETKDTMELDNRAYCIINRPKQAKVLIVSDGNRFLELAVTERVKKLASVEFEIPSFLESEEYRTQALSGEYDLIIYDRVSPEEHPQANAFYIKSLPPGDEWKKTEPFNRVAIIDYSRSHRITQFVELTRLIIVEASALTGPTATKSLVDAKEGSLMSIAPRQGFQDLVLGFSIVESQPDGTDELNTDWPNHPSFPLIIKSIVQYLGGVAEMDVAQNTRTGSPVKIKIEEQFKTINVKTPEGKKSTLRRAPNNTFLFADTAQIGVYEIDSKESEELLEKFAVNLMDKRESDIRVRENLDIGFQEIKGTQINQIVRKEYWKWIVVVALVVLFFEWIVYNRRILV